MIAFLGVTKAGKIVVPVDPAWPDARISQVLTETEAALVVADRDMLPRAEGLLEDRGRVLALDQLEIETSEDDLALPLGPDRLASIFFTSSSTGPPKGVVQNHRNLLHGALRSTNGCHTSASDRVTYLASPAFAASLTDLLSSLLSGACLLPYSIREQGLGELASWLAREAITVYHSVPTVFRGLARLLDGTISFPDLRLIILGGEAVTPHDVELFRTHFAPPCLLDVGLGSTETNVIRRLFIDHDLPIDGRRVPVGYPVDDMEVSIVDSEGNALERGETGEIAVTSRFLSPGYWRRPDLSADRFREAALKPGERLYLTGDLGRMRADGCLEHWGRIDLQVKISGQRVEVEEVEAALLKHGGLRAAAVVARAHRDGESRLVAYLVAAGPPAAPVDTRELSRRLAQQLTAAMIPSLYVLLEGLPLTPTGKVDRRALAINPAFAPRPVESPVSEPLAPPVSPTEAALTALWSKVLGCGPVGARDDFLALGGDSLKAMELAAVIEKSLGRPLSWTAILESPTPAELALRIDEREHDQARSMLNVVQEGASGPPLVFAPGAGYHPSDFARFARALGPDVGLWSFNYGENLDIEALAGRLVDELRRARPRGPYHLGGYSYGGLIAYEAARILHSQGEEIGLLAFVDVRGPGFPRKITSPWESLLKRGAKLRSLPVAGQIQYLKTLARSALSRGVRLLETVARLAATTRPSNRSRNFAATAPRISPRFPAIPGRSRCFVLVTSRTRTCTRLKTRPTDGDHWSTEACGRCSYPGRTGR